jgi:YfiH family protein
MERIENDGLIYYRFEHPALKDVAHGAFTRAGGDSRPPYNGLNMAFFDEEDHDTVRTNIDRAALALGLDRPASVGQVHGIEALVVRADDGYRPGVGAEVRRGFDALITPDPGVALLTKLADCQGVVLYDPSTEVLGLVHSGWRGSVQNILGQTVRRMVDDFGANPASMAAGIGPSLGPCCAEFIHYRSELPESFWPYRYGNHFDFWSISRDQLAAEGLKAPNVEIGGICTKCGAEGFYSHRRKEAGRFGLIAGRKA